MEVEWKALEVDTAVAQPLPGGEVGAAVYLPAASRLALIMAVLPSFLPSCRGTRGPPREAAT